MKVVTIDEGVSSGAKVVTTELKNGTKLPVLAVGENGRGRKFTYAVVDLALENQKAFKADGCCYVGNLRQTSTKAGGLKFVEDYTANDDGYLAVFRTSFGFRGSNGHFGDWNGEPFDSDEPKGSNCFRLPGEVLMRGVIADGAAGSMASGEQLVVKLPFGAIIRVGYSGRRYGKPTAYYYNFTKDEVIMATWEERQQTDIF